MMKQFGLMTLIPQLLGEIMGIRRDDGKPTYILRARRRHS